MEEIRTNSSALQASELGLTRNDIVRINSVEDALLSGPPFNLKPELQGIVVNFNEYFGFSKSEPGPNDIEMPTGLIIRDLSIMADDHLFVLWSNYAVLSIAVMGNGKIRWTKVGTGPAPRLATFGKGSALEQ